MLDEQSKQRVRYLCEQIAKEQDHRQFSILVAELNDLLEQFDPASRDAEEEEPTSPGKSS